MEPSVLAEKAYAFALRVVRLYRHLYKPGAEAVLLRQLLRCGTSVGANVHEAGVAQSPADFISKLGIARKEAAESTYWLRLLHDAGYLDTPGYTSLQADSQELGRLLTASVKTAQKRRLNE